MSLWPQYAYIALSLFGLGVCFATHGKPREPMNVWSTLLASALIWFLLAKGGFFDGMFK